jgi:type II secretory pathway pseudopilin PulG
MKNQKGITLVELLVYMVLFSIVALIIQSQYVKMASTVHREKQITTIQSDSRSILTILQRDIQNMGCKIFLTDAADGFNKNIDPRSFQSDSSSFICREGNPSDTLKIYKTILTNVGGYARSDSVKFYLTGDSLIKERDDIRFTVCGGVYALQFQYGITASDSMIFDLYPLPNPGYWMVSNVGGTIPTTQAQGSSTKVSFTGPAIGRVYYLSSFSTDKDQQLKVSLWLTPDASFISNLDSAYCSIYDGSTRIGYNKFIPSGLKTDLLISMPQRNGVKVAIEYWTKGSGSLLINGIEIRRANDGEYVWVDTPIQSKKKLVKAIKVHVLTRSRANAGVSVDTPVPVANISYPRSGKFIWRSFEEVIFTPNNGIF